MTVRQVPACVCLRRFGLLAKSFLSSPPLQPADRVLPPQSAPSLDNDLRLATLRLRGTDSSRQPAMRSDALSLDVWLVPRDDSLDAMRLTAAPFAARRPSQGHQHGRDNQSRRRSLPVAAGRGRTRRSSLQARVGSDAHRNDSRRRTREREKFPSERIGNESKFRRRSRTWSPTPTLLPFRCGLALPCVALGCMDVAAACLRRLPKSRRDSRAMRVAPLPASLLAEKQISLIVRRRRNLERVRKRSVASPIPHSALHLPLPNAWTHPSLAEEKSLKSSGLASEKRSVVREWDSIPKDSTKEWRGGRSYLYDTDGRNEEGGSAQPEQ